MVDGDECGGDGGRGTFNVIAVVVVIIDGT